MLPSPSLLLSATFADLPGATLGYLLLYLGTLVIHVVFMGYVLAGSAYLAGVVTLRKADSADPFEPLLREWLPFMLSLAITAGVAPLLFIQILYRLQFYTANLLLFHRWMAVVPVLIAAFYLLYLLKIRRAAAWPGAVRIAIALVAATCFVFVAWSWTENHLLSLAGQQVWTEQYVSPSRFYHSSEVVPRLGIWFSGTFPILAVWLGWQAWWSASAGGTSTPLSDDNQSRSAARRAAIIGLGGLAAALICGALYGVALPADQRIALSHPPLLIAWGVAAMGLVIATLLFVRQWQSRQLALLPLSLQSMALVGAIAGVACLREAIRLHVVDVAAHFPTHEAAADVGGRWVFAAFVVINAILIGCCVRAVLPQTAAGRGDRSGDAV
jgi:hypothetical protein